MPDRDMAFSLKAFFDGRAAMRGLRRFARGFTRSVQGMTRSAGLGAGFAGIGGRFRPGGAGGILSGLVQGATGLAMAPVRILAGFAKLIPGIGGILGGVVSTGANILQGLVGIAANVVGGIVNALGKLVAAAARIFTRMVAVAGRILGKLVKVAAGIGLAVGAVLGWQMIKGIRENMQLADIRAVMQKTFGPLAAEMEKLARTLSLATPFTPMEVLRTVTTLGAARVEVKKYIGDVLDLAAATKGLGIRLEDVARVFARVRSGSFGEAFERLREMTISRPELEAAGLTFSKAGQFMGTPDEALRGIAKVIRSRFANMARQAAEVGSGPWSTFVGVIQDLRMELSGPWYERFNNALKDMNGWLLSLKDTGAWRAIMAGSEAAADAVDRFVRNLIDTDWAAAWKGMLSFPQRMWDEVIPDIGKLFAEKTAEGWVMGPVSEKILGGLERLKLEALKILEGLWGAIGQRAMETTRDVFNKLSGVFNRMANQVGERDKQALLRQLRDPNQQTAIWDYPKGLRARAPFTSNEEMIRLVGATPASEFVSIAEGEQVKAFKAAADGMSDMATAAHKAGENASDSAGRIADLNAEIDALNRRLDAAEKERPLKAELGGVWQKAGRVIRETFPVKSPADVAAERQAALRQTPGYKGRAAQIAKKRKTAGYARAAGYIEDAERLVAEADQLQLYLDAYLDKAEDAFERLDEKQKEMGDTLRRHGNKLKNIGTARAR